MVIQKQLSADNFCVLRIHGTQLPRFYLIVPVIGELIKQEEEPLSFSETRSFVQLQIFYLFHLKIKTDRTVFKLGCFRFEIRTFEKFFDVFTIASITSSGLGIISTIFRSSSAVIPSALPFLSCAKILFVSRDFTTISTNCLLLGFNSIP